jgi:hypothetical protein
MNQRQSTTATIPFSIHVESMSSQLRLQTTKESENTHAQLSSGAVFSMHNTQVLLDIYVKYDSHIPRWFLWKSCYKHETGLNTAPEARASLTHCHA